MQARFGELEITGSRFRVNDYNNDSIVPEGINFKHLDVTGISLLAENGAIIGDTITTNIKNLTLGKRAGSAY